MTSTTAFISIIHNASANLLRSFLNTVFWSTFSDESLANVSERQMLLLLAALSK